MALSRTWYSDANIVTAASGSKMELVKSTIWGLKALLMNNITGSRGANGAAPTGSYWTCVSSSDSVTANASDNWGSSYDSSKLVTGSNGNAHSWIVLKSSNAIATDGPYYLLMDFDKTTEGQVTFKYSKNNFTGGTSTSSPTSTNSVNSNNSFNSNWYDDTSTDIEIRINICRDSNGSFYYTVVKNNKGCISMFALCSLEDMHASDTWRVWSISNTANDAEVNNTNIASTFFAGRTYNGSALSDYENSTCGLSTFSFNGNLLHNLSSTDSINAITSKYFTCPLFVYSLNDNLSGYRGKFPDAALIGDGKNSGDVVPSVGNVEQCLFGNLLLPFDIQVTV